MKAGWKKTPLGDLIDIHDSRRIPLSGAQRSQRQGKYPYYGAQSIIDYIDDYIFDGKFLLIAEDGENLRSRKEPIAFFASGKFWVNNHAHIVTAKSELADDYFIKACLNHANLAAYVTGAAQPKLSQGNLKLIELDLPDLPTQRKIAGILSAYDDLIENNLRRIKILEEMAQSLYREWFVHFRFPGHEAVRFIDSELGQIPKGWEVRTIEELVKRIPVGKKYDQKTANPTGTVPIFDQGKAGVIGYHDDQPGVEASEGEPVIVFANHTCYQRLVHYPFSAIQNVLPFRPNPLLSRNIYWLHYATNGRLVLNDYKGHWPEFAALLVIVPPAEVCQRFGAFVAPLSLEILKLERAIEILRRTRDLLLPQLLSCGEK